MPLEGEEPPRVRHEWARRYLGHYMDDIHTRNPDRILRLPMLHPRTNVADTALMATVLQAFDETQSRRSINNCTAVYQYAQRKNLSLEQIKALLARNRCLHVFNPHTEFDFLRSVAREGRGKRRAADSRIRRCRALTRKGVPCRNPVATSRRCQHHTPRPRRLPRLRLVPRGDRDAAG